MKKSFTTFDIVKILDISRNLLAQWLLRGYIEPSIQRAQGVGTKSLFSLDDLYTIRLFQQLVHSGINRNEARLYAAVTFKNVGPEKDQFKYSVYTRKVGKRAKQKIWASGELQKESPTVKFDDDDSYIVVINLLGIKNFVDNKIK